MNDLLSTEQLEALRLLDTCTVANAIDTFGVRLRNEGYMDDTVRCLFPQFPPMLGYAATLTFRGSAPPTDDGLFPERTDWWDYLLTIPAPRVLVLQDVASRPGHGALIGVVHMNLLRALDCVGVVTNGDVRSLPAAESAGLHLFASGIAVSHAYLHIIGLGVPVEVGGLKVHSGDLLHGDLHGVQSIPLEIANQIPAVAAQITAKEQELVALCQSPGFSLQQLRAAIRKESPQPSRWSPLQW
jgi:4-hydroxy-4-methyl-2-oxoglutarate aldolase